MNTFLETAGSLWRVLLGALVFGAGLPIVFALGIRSLAPSGVDGSAQRNPASALLGWLFIGLVVVAVVLGVLFIAKDFIGHNLGISLFGAKTK